MEKKVFVNYQPNLPQHLFDFNYYQNSNNLSFGHKLDAWTHFMKTGRFNGLNYRFLLPNTRAQEIDLQVQSIPIMNGLNFDFDYYLKNNNDLQHLAGNMVGLWNHFYYFGQFENRLFRFWLDRLSPQRTTPITLLGLPEKVTGYLVQLGTYCKLIASNQNVNLKLLSLQGKLGLEMDQSIKVITGELVIYNLENNQRYASPITSDRSYSFQLSDPIPPLFQNFRAHLFLEIAMTES